MPDIVGFIDGTHIMLHKEPALDKDQAATFFCRKKRYAVLVLAICDDRKRFLYVQTGHHGAASDARAQLHVTMLNEPERHFSPNEVLLGDSGFTTKPELVAMYRDWAGTRMPAYQRFFNAQVAPARVAIEHAFGVLKMRWKSLKDLHMRVGSQTDLDVLLGWVRCAFLLHNLFIDTSSRYWEPSDYAEARKLEEEINAANAEDDVINDALSFEQRRDRLAYDIHVLVHPERVAARRMLFRDVFSL